MDGVTDRALEAAAFVIQEGAADRLTLEGVAEAADLPAEAVTARWPTVGHLVRAVVERGYATKMARIAAAMGDDESPGAYTRAYIEGSFPSDRESYDFVDLAASLFRSGPIEPETFAAIRARQAEIKAALAADGLEPATANMVRFAVDGLFMNEVFGIAVLSETERSQLLAKLRSVCGAPALME